MRMFSVSWVVLSVGMLLGCFPRGDPSRPIPTELVAAPTAARRVVIVLPGRADDIADLRRSGIAQAVQAAWPDADVILTGLALGYYLDSHPGRRLHDEVIEPARKRGYTQVWLVGASLGGLGALIHDITYPNGVDGMVLLAPYLGEEPLVKEITAAWRNAPERAKNVWLAYGKTDRLRDSMPLLTPLLPPGHVLVRDGGHDWETWSPATREILQRVDAQNPAAKSP